MTGSWSLAPVFCLIGTLLYFGYLDEVCADGRFRAVVAIATKYSNQLSNQPSLAKAAPFVEQGLRNYAKRLGYADSQIEISLLLDVDGIAAKTAASSADEIRAAVYDAAYASYDPQDTLVFFFTGHGASEGSNILLYASGADGRRPVSRVLLEAEILTPQWRLSKAGIKMIVIDACHTPAAGALPGGAALLGSGTLSALEHSSTARTASQGTVMFFAADEGGTAWVDDTRGYGFFTRRFIAALSLQGQLTAQTLIREIRTKVSDDVQKHFPDTGRSQVPEMRILASGGDYQLTFDGAAAITRPSNTSATAQKPTPPDSRPSIPSTALLKSEQTIYDERTGLLWARDLTLLGPTTALFAGVRDGTLTIQGALIRIEQQVQRLTHAGFSNWRLATRSELEGLNGSGGASLFLTFQRKSGQYQNLLGIYGSADSRYPKVWGYQYANTLIGPIEFNSGDPTLNAFGIWLVTGPMKKPSEQFTSVEEAAEPVVQQSLTPIVSAVLTKKSQGIAVSTEPEILGEVGNLDGNQQSVFEFSLKQLENETLVRAEILLRGVSASGQDPTVEITTYTGDGVATASLFDSANTDPAAKWFFSGRTQIEIPIHLVANRFHAGEILGLRFRYKGDSGNARFAVPKLIVSYVPNSSLLSRRKDFGRT